MRKGINIPIWYQNNRLITLRKEHGLNQTQIADSIKCVLKTYQNYEQGRNYPTLEYATKLSDLYNVSIDYLLGRSDYVKVENEMISEIIHLSDNAITSIQNATEYERLLLDTLLSKKYFTDICFSIYSYMQTYYKDLHIKDENTGDIILKESEKMEFAEYRATKHFSDVLINKIANDEDIKNYNGYEHDLETAVHILNNPKFQNTISDLSTELKDFKKNNGGKYKDFIESKKQKSKGSDKNETT